MSKSLVIVESPAKAKTINKYLGSEFKVSASMGHVRDLPRATLGVNTDDNFKPKYVVIPERKKILKELKELASKVDSIYLAPDPDREGEAIAWHLAQELEACLVGTKKQLRRLTFNEITKPAIVEALKNPSKIDINKVDAQQARRILDRLVGYLISPILSKKVQKGLSAGRVQSVAVRLICDREKEIEAFVPEEYWSIIAKLQKKTKERFIAKLEKIDTKKVNISNKDEAEAILKELKGKEFIVDKVIKKDKRQNPVPPFITSTLQQEAVRKLGFNAKKAMSIAQQLYEGLDVGEKDPVGVITYMRTDAVRVSEEAQSQAREYVKGKFGSQYLPPTPPVYKSKKLAQEAHEAIRPTSVFKTPDEIKEYLTPDQYKLYKLIWTRFVASQMNPALLAITRVEILATNKFLFVATGTVVKFDGFMAIYTEGKDEKEEDEEETLPQMKEKEPLNLLELIPGQHFTQPPPRYTEATLVKTLEEKGIGRPSTYAAIITTIQDRDYAKLQEKKFYPTELGKLVTELLVKSFPDILDAGFTAQLEEKLDKIEEGELIWTKVLDEFYTPFKDSLAKAKEIMTNVKKQQEEVTSILCEKCGKPMVVKMGRYGKFLSCPGYPDCKNIKNIELKENGEIKIKEEEKTEVVCDICGKPMVIKQGRYGKFLSCSGYPKCKNMKPLEKKKTETIATDIKCEKCEANMVLREGRNGKFLACSSYPKCKFTKSVSSGFACPAGCGGELAKKRSKKGFFYGCSNYPKCEFATWGEPIQTPCPECGYMVVRRKSKSGMDVLICARKGCSYEEVGKQ
ncbi:MAG: type I DNA topoisomerase [Nitrospirota bacterium]